MSGFDIGAAAHCTTLVFCVGVMVASLEDLASASVFSRGGILDWDVLSLQNRWTVSGWTSQWAAHLFGLRGMRFSSALRALAAALLLATPSGRMASVLLGFIYLSLLALTLRSPYGLDGAHQMYQIGFGALFLFHLATPNSLAAHACLYFVGAQALFGYFVSGLSKLGSPVWRSGVAITGIFSAALYGNRRFFLFLNDAPRLAWLLSWGVIIFECSMVLTPFLADRWCLAMLTIGLLFHAVNAILMGLNGFFFAFVGTYPAIYLLAQCFRQ